MAQQPQMDKHIARRLVQKKKKLDEYRPLTPFVVQRLHKEQNLPSLKTHSTSAK
jgi:hypothetical protein